MQAQNVSELDTEQRKQLAREHAALFPARLALTRWTSSNEIQQQLDPRHPPLRARWLSLAQHHFQVWLENGGFVQYDD